MLRIEIVLSFCGSATTCEITVLGIKGEYLRTDSGTIRQNRWARIYIYLVQKDTDAVEAYVFQQLSTSWRPTFTIVALLSNLPPRRFIHQYPSEQQRPEFVTCQVTNYRHRSKQDVNQHVESPLNCRSRLDTRSPQLLKSTTSKWIHSSTENWRKYEQTCRSVLIEESTACFQVFANIGSAALLNLAYLIKYSK